METNNLVSDIKLSKLISEANAPFFTRQNLEVLFGANRRNLDYKIKAMIRDELLIPLKSGFYLNTALYQKTSNREDLLAYVGGMMVSPSYVSLEYALALYGILAEAVFTFTYVTIKKPRVFQNGQFSFSYRNIKSDLFFGFVPKKYQDFVYYLATPAKAIFDYIYLTPLGRSKLMREFLFESRFNWDVLEDKDKVEFRQIVKRSGSTKMRLVEKHLLKGGVL